MSSVPEAMKAKEDDIAKMLVAEVHVGTDKSGARMSEYIYKRRQEDGLHLLHLGKTWEKLMLAARAIVAVENPEDVCVLSAREYGQRAVLKFAQYTGAHCIAGRFTPGTLTNQLTRTFREPRVLLVTDPRTDVRAIEEAALTNVPVIALCDSDAPIANVDIVIPCNNRGAHSIGLVYWLLSREVLRLRGTLSRSVDWEVPVDLFFYRDPKQLEEEQAATTAVTTEAAPVVEAASWEAPVEGAVATA